jgi:hypothetical protein
MEMNSSAALFGGEENDVVIISMRKRNQGFRDRR